MNLLIEIDFKVYPKGGVIMVSVLDVAEYILRKLGPLTSFKLQKLVYYCQAWSLVWDDEPLFHEKLEAWANGPVVPELFEAHRRRFKVGSIKKGAPKKLNQQQKETINAVLEYYGKRSSQWLTDLTHMEKPWREARTGIPDEVRSHEIISIASMAEYYGGL